MSKGYYNILGVGKWATLEEIRKAYYDQAKVCHPDKGGDYEMFKQLNDAYGVLKDDRLRRSYDEGTIPGAPSYRKERCPDCGGEGRIFEQRSFTIRIETNCKSCKGEGRIIP